MTPQELKLIERFRALGVPGQAIVVAWAQCAAKRAAENEGETTHERELLQWFRMLGRDGRAEVMEKAVDELQRVREREQESRALFPERWPSRSEPAFNDFLRRVQGI